MKQNRLERKKITANLQKRNNIQKFMQFLAFIEFFILFTPFNFLNLKKKTY